MTSDRGNQPVLDDPSLRPVIERAVAELQAKTAALDAIIHFSKTNWLLDQDAGTITFTRRRGRQATAPAQIVGTYSLADSTWLWAWDHPSVVESLRRDAILVHDYGKERGIAALTTRKLLCRESDCWEFAALACKIAGAHGAYRGPSGNTLVFMTFGQISLTNK